MSMMSIAGVLAGIGAEQGPDESSRLPLSRRAGSRVVCEAVQVHIYGIVDTHIAIAVCTLQLVRLALQQLVLLAVVSLLPLGLL